MADFSAAVEVTRLWHVGAWLDGEYVIGSEFSCLMPEEAEDWFMHEFAGELSGDEEIEIEHVGYTIYDFNDDCIDLYL